MTLNGRHDACEQRMKQMRFQSILLTLMFLTVGACYDSPSTAIRMPGEYKGAVDPLLEKQRLAKQQETLKARLLLVQTDR